MIARSMTIKGFKLELTCGACPEQYEAYQGLKQVAYFRLRHGRFYAEVPRHGGERVYESTAMHGDGSFVYSERERFLTEAILSVKDHIELKTG